MEREALMQLGLSDAESTLYLALLGTGPSRAGSLIKLTGFHKGTTYQVLERLKEKGLVSSVIQGKKQHFQAADPDRLRDMLARKEEALAAALPMLHARQRRTAMTDITVYSGVRGIQSAMDAMLEELNPAGAYCDFGSSGIFRDVMRGYFSAWQRKKRKYGIKARVTFSDAIRRTHPDVLKEFHGEARFHPEAYASPTDTMIYNDTVILFLWKATPPVAVVIKDKENARGYRNQFELLWRSAKRN
jgi:sugar-specific transcriptional regulator TrmB